MRASYRSLKAEKDVNCYVDEERSRFLATATFLDAPPKDVRKLVGPPGLEPEREEKAVIG